MSDGKYHLLGSGLWSDSPHNRLLVLMYILWGRNFSFLSRLSIILLAVCKLLFALVFYSLLKTSVAFIVNKWSRRNGHEHKIQDFGISGKDRRIGVFSILQPHLCQWDILLWDTLLWDILLQLYTSTNSLHKPLTKSFWNTSNKKYVNKYL